MQCFSLPANLITCWRYWTECINRDLTHSYVQAGVAASRSLEEVASLEKALCLLIGRAADIQNAKLSGLMTPLDRDTAAPLANAESNNASSLNRGALHAVHAEASTSKVGDESADGGKAAVTATSELITPEIEKQLPKAARRVSP